MTEDNIESIWRKVMNTSADHCPMMFAKMLLEVNDVSKDKQLTEAKECLAWAFDLAESHDSYMTSAYKDCDRKWSVRCKDVLK